MAAGMAIAGGLKAVGSIFGYKKSKSAAGDQYAADQRNIERIKAENEETVERTQESMRQIESTALTAGSGSGFARKAGNVKGNYLEGLKGVHRADLAWLQESQSSGVEIAKSEASLRYGARKDAATSNLISGLGSAVGIGVGAYGSYKETDGKWW